MAEKTIRQRLQHLGIDTGDHDEDIRQLLTKMETLMGPKCPTSTDVCPDYDGEHPWHQNAKVLAHEAGNRKALGYFGGPER